MTRTVSFEIGVALEGGDDRFWIQMRWSDGEVRPIGILHDSIEDLLEDFESKNDGKTYGIERVIVRASRVPQSRGDLLN